MNKQLELFVIKLRITKADGSIMNGYELLIGNRVKNTSDFYKPRDNRINTEDENIHVIDAIRLYKNIEVIDVVSIENTDEYRDSVDDIRRKIKH